jgi:rsbT antagonist protein RsbS
MEHKTIPIIKLESKLIVSIQTDLDDATALQLQDDIAQTIIKTSASGVILDVSAIEIMDSYTARIFNDIGKNSMLLGARTILVGLQPAIAITLVEMGMDIENVETALNLESGLELFEANDDETWEQEKDDWDEAGEGVSE